MYRIRKFCILPSCSPCSDIITCAIGAFAETLSLTLWNVYFSDFIIPDHPDDVILNEVRISHVERTDDVALIYFSSEGAEGRPAGICSMRCRWLTGTFGRLSLSHPKPISIIVMAKADTSLIAEYEIVPDVDVAVSEELRHSLDVHSCGNRARHTTTGLRSLTSRITTNCLLRESMSRTTSELGDL
ncbi:uncharacterized protein EV420DRAFT_1635745 [Desarmillaria tabescens]|uniref:Uncharacterized protein n=1 Tax=Armillaria tabescens TaxID=1929756 RepID=A0AA39TWH9_ARMTA|nr:uncharacterized protein EV420DRAFT_1635745 [Desarmillaria tabescens]KAK0468493.1 hypothetical protein EV420DRAFT_1635745 [Desarmillaria tabescens]